MVHMMDAGTFTRRKHVKPELLEEQEDWKRARVEQVVLEEPSPLGLKLKKSPSFLDLIHMRLSQAERGASLAKTLPRRDKDTHSKGGVPSSSSSSDKLKASNFPATLLKIGTWEYKSRYEGDLVAKCYFAKHKLVWEVLDGGLKNKVEIQWSDIMAIKANYSEDGPETIDVVLSRQPLFFREINPQPRKHTLWQATSDFTGGQATIYRRHFLQCSQGLLGKHFEKLVQCDPRLNFLSQQPQIVLDNPYFESKSSLFGAIDESENSYDLKTESGSSLFELHDRASTSPAFASHAGREDSVTTTPSELNSGTPPAPDLCRVGGGLAGNRMKDIEKMKILNHIKVPGIHPSMSMSDLVSHIGQCISEQMTTVNHGTSIDEEEKNNILEDIAQYLLSDSQATPILDEKSLMSRVNSLCCLLQKDPSSTNLQARYEDAVNLPGNRMDGPKSVSASRGENILKVIPESHVESNVRNDWNEPSSMSRKDSVGDLLMNLPRIASLPQFLFNFWEDHGTQS